MKKRIALLILLYCILLCGCADNTPGIQRSNISDGYKLYYLDSGDTQLVFEEYIPEVTDRDGLISEFIQALNKAPSNFAYVNAKPADVQITDMLLDEDGLLILNFNTAYKNITGIKEILCRAAIVKTFCQIDGVEYVEFYVNGQPLIIAGEIPVGRMRSSDFIDNTGDSNDYIQESKVRIYFANETGDMLLESILIVKNNGLKSQEQLVLEQLLSGPLEEQTNMRPVIAEGTKLNSVTTKDGICYVDFNENFMNLREGVNADVVIYSIVNSLIELPHITKVQFYINGDTRKQFSDIEFSGLFERNLELMVNEKAGESQ